MSTSIASATLDFLRWVDARDATYDEAFAAWQTSCPRLSPWEDAFIDRLVCISTDDDGRSMVTLTARGRSLLEHA